MKAVIFDMDGVIVDSEAHWNRLFDPFLRNLFPETFDPEVLHELTGLNRIDTFYFLRDRFSLSMSEIEFNLVMDGMARRVYTEICGLLPGLLDLLDKIKAENLPIGLASSSNMDWIHLVLNRFHLKEYFSSVVGSDKVAGRGKPKPDIYLKSLEELGFDAKEAVAIEDSERGVLSAKNAGVFCVGLRNGMNAGQDLSRADLQIEGLGKIRLSDLRSFFPEAL